MRGVTPIAVHRREDGAVAIIVALMLVLFVAMVAVVVDTGGLYLRRRELVNGSDAAAMSAGRTCARGGADDRFAAPEEAADFHVQQNGEITGFEVVGPNIVDMAGCGEQSGHVSVEYTSQQELFFAPAIGFEQSKPVTTEATASWGLGSNNVVPLVVSGLISVSCPLPPSGTPTMGQTCAFWYDNDLLNGGNFAFLSLNPAGWNVPIGDNCSGAQSGGTSQLTDWIDGTSPASVALNWTEPTYVCSDAGIRGVGVKGDGEQNSKIWGALEDLIGKTRDFPINWEGPGAPIFGAPEQGTVYQNSQIHKYDIIGFAFLEIVDVLSVQETEGGPGNCETKNSDPVVWTAPGQTLELDTITATTPGWRGCPSRIPDDITSVSVTAKGNAPTVQPGDYTYEPSTRTITWNSPIVPRNTLVSFGWEIDPNNGPCGQLPTNNSAMCVITEWRGSTLGDDFVPGGDKNTVIRLCDRDYGTCLDQ